MPQSGSMHRGLLVAFFLLLIACGTPTTSNLRLSTLRLQQVTTVEQARAVYTELVPLTAPAEPLSVQDKQDRDEFHAANVRVLKTFGRDPLVKAAYTRFTSSQADLAERLQ